MKLVHGAIINGKFWTAGTDIPKDIVPRSMLKYQATKEEKPQRREINLRRELGQRYYVDEEGRMTVPARRAAAELEAQNAEQDYIDQVSMEPPSESVQAAIEDLRAEHQANVQKQMAQAECLARHADELDDDVAQRHEEKVEAGEFNDMDVDLPPAKVKPKAYAKLFVKRGNNKFILASNTDLIEGEPLYRYRKRELGKVAMYIRHTVVK
jgi:hypothetical protein